MKIMKNLEIHERSLKNMKITEIQSRVKKIIKIVEINARIMKINKIFGNPFANHEKNENIINQ